eukprot:9479056-Pyramimonas_sp.AAC.2
MPSNHHIRHCRHPTLFKQWVNTQCSNIQWRSPPLSSSRLADSAENQGGVGGDPPYVGLGPIIHNKDRRQAY